jgi:spore coat polysaccharide biosynthesis predicted glycosyltransferase SpsG
MTQNMCQNKICGHVEQIQKLLEQIQEFGYAAIMDYICHITADCLRLQKSKRFMQVIQNKLITFHNVDTQIFDNLGVDLCKDHYQILFKQHLPNCDHKFTRSGLIY